MPFHGIGGGGGGGAIQLKDEDKVMSHSLYQEGLIFYGLTSMNLQLSTKRMLRKFPIWIQHLVCYFSGEKWPGI